MVELFLGILIIGYTGFVIYKKARDVKAGKSCCSGCSTCPSSQKCSEKDIQH